MSLSNDSGEGQTKRGPSGNAIGIDGPEPHARSSCAYPYATLCPYCVPDAEWAAMLAEYERCKQSVIDARMNPLPGQRKP